MEGTITIMGDTQIATEAIQVMAMEDTQAMVMEDIQTTIKITGTLETVSELLEATKSKIRQSHSEHNQFQYYRSVSAQTYVKVNTR